MVVVITVDLRIKEWKGQQKLIEIFSIVFLTVVVQLCTNRTKSVLHTNCIALHMTLNMAIIIQKHGYMNKERLELEMDICMDTWHLTKVLGCVYY